MIIIEMRPSKYVVSQECKVKESKVLGIHTPTDYKVMIDDDSIKQLSFTFFFFS